MPSADTMRAAPYEPTQIQTRVKKMLQDRDERFIKTVPREQRNQVRQELLQ